MNKKLLAVALYFLVLAFNHHALAQVVFVNPQFTNSQTDFTISTNTGPATPKSGSVPISPSAQYYFSVTVFRNSSSAEQGYVSLFSGVNGPDNQLTNSQIGTYNTSSGGWTSSGGVDSHMLSGYISTSAIPSGNQKLYAVFFSQTTNPATKGAVSAPILIVPGSASPPPTLPSYPVAQSSFCLNAGSPLPTLDAGYFLGYAVGGQAGDSRFLWETSADGGLTYNFIYTDEVNASYTPPNLWYAYTTVYRKVFYRASLQYKYNYVVTSEWKTSRSTIFTVDVRGVQPVPAAPIIYSCGNSTGVAVIQHPSQVTYNWWVPYAGWTISNNGSNPFSTYNTNSSFTTSQANVVITPPAGIAAGDYTITVSSNGSCGNKSADVTLIFRVGYAPSPDPLGGSFYIMNYQNCRKYYGFVMPIIQSPTPYRYFATASTGQSVEGQNNGNGYVTFPLNAEGASNYATATVITLGPCGQSQSVLSNSQYLEGPDPSCVGDGTTERIGVSPNSPVSSSPNPKLVNKLSPDAYPNPADNQLTLQNNGLDTHATLSDITGRKCINVFLPASVINTKISTSKFSNGIYFLQMIQDNKTILTKKIVIAH